MVFQQKAKFLHVITGTMFAGKTKLLIEKISSFRKQNKKVLVLKPDVDNRFATNQLVSHNGLKVSAISTNERDFYHQVKQILQSSNYDVLAIDEFHFFSPKIIPFIDEFLKEYDVLLAGLNKGVCQNNLEIMNQILTKADFIDKLNGKCQKCGQIGNQVLPVNCLEVAQMRGKDFVGGQEKYILLCFFCANVWKNQKQ